MSNPRPSRSMLMFIFEFREESLRNSARLRFSVSAFNVKNGSSFLIKSTFPSKEASVESETISILKERILSNISDVISNELNSKDSKLDFCKTEETFAFIVAGLNPSPSIFISELRFVLNFITGDKSRLIEVNLISYFALSGLKLNELFRVKLPFEDSIETLVMNSSGFPLYFN